MISIINDIKLANATTGFSVHNHTAPLHFAIPSDFKMDLRIMPLSHQQVASARYAIHCPLYQWPCALNTAVKFEKKKNNGYSR